MLIFIIAAVVWLATLLKKPVDQRPAFIKKSTLYAVVASFVGLAMMGKLNWILAGLSLAVAFLSRYLPVAMRYAPQLQRLWFLFQAQSANAKGSQQGQSQNRQAGSSSGEMTVEEAYKVLGVSSSATREDIVDAHRKLMFKNHPDRGGSSYLAAQINRAKELLVNTHS